MELDCHLFEGFLDLIISGTPLQAQYLIVVLLPICHSRRENDEAEQGDGK
jgi:hypothetical protein